RGERQRPAAGARAKVGTKAGYENAPPARRACLCPTFRSFRNFKQPPVSHLAPPAGRGRRVSAGRGGLTAHSVFAEPAPHPNPLPAKCGAREKKDTPPHSRGAFRPSDARIIRPEKSEGAG